MKLRAVVVDDEPAARAAVRDHCRADGAIEVVGDCDSGHDAVTAIRRNSPDVVFLDINMRPMTGFDVVAALDPEAVPAVVFVTAHDEFAVRAFEVNALDYLLKPFSAERFEAAMGRVRGRLVEASGSRAFGRDLRELAVAISHELATQRSDDDGRLIVETGERVQFVDPKDIESAEADGNYVTLHVAGNSYTVRYAMKDLELRLAPPRFLRIHRSILVNTAHVRTMEKWFHGEYVIEMDSGRRYTSGRTFRQRLQALVLRSRGD